MNDLIQHRAFFGDAEYTFCLTDPMLAELEKITGLGVGALYFSMMPKLAYPVSHLREIIRLGLIGGGMNPERANRLCEAYGVNRPLAEVMGLAFDILAVRWNGQASGDDALPVAACATALKSRPRCLSRMLARSPAPLGPLAHLTGWAM